MAATVVDGSVSSSTWQKAKPKDYKGGKELEAAIKSVETLNNKDISIAALPTMPAKNSIKEYKQFSKDLKSSSDEVTSVLVAHFTSLQEALKKVASAADATKTDLSNIAKDKSGDDKKKYENAASTASAISSMASGAVKKLN
jgi:hypothetical protein